MSHHPTPREFHLAHEDGSRGSVPPVPAHLFGTPRVEVSPRRVLDVPDEPGAVGQDFPGAVS